MKIDPTAFGLTEEQIQPSTKLWTILFSCLKDKAMDMMCNTQENNGLEVYRKLSRRGLIRTPGHDRGRLVQLITPDQEMLKLDYFTRLDKWEDKVAEYERLSGDKVSDKIMAGVL